MASKTIPSAFTWRRLQSLMGLWLVIFLVEHLFINSQAALFIGNDGQGFINAANALENIPYLQLTEFLLLAVPFFIHIVWGIKYLMTAKYNSFGSEGSEPYLPEYSRNHAYTWQRITAWILIIAVIAHVIHMRFIERPISTEEGSQHYYFVKVNLDEGLYTLAERLNVSLYDENKIKETENQISQNPPAHLIDTPEERVQQQSFLQKKEGLEALKKHLLQKGQAIAVADNFGTAELLMLRETFKMPIMLVLYTLFVLMACYHAFNGLWTCFIKWGITLSQRSQRWMLRVSTALMILVSFLGLSAVWATYWINLKQ